MIDPGYVRTFARYNAWMNGRIYECCARLPDERRKRDDGAFFRSIHGTLNHLLLGDRVWMGRFVGPLFAPGSLADELYADFAALREARHAEDERITRWAAALTPEVLSGRLRYTSIVNPQPREMDYAYAVTHFFNHQTHHRGQVTTLLSQAGIDPGATDLMWLPAEAG